MSEIKCQDSWRQFLWISRCGNRVSVWDATNFQLPAKSNGRADARRSRLPGADWWPRSSRPGRVRLGGSRPASDEPLMGSASAAWFWRIISCPKPGSVASCLDASLAGKEANTRSFDFGFPRWRRRAGALLRSGRQAR